MLNTLDLANRFVANLNELSREGEAAPRVRVPVHAGASTATYWWDDRTPLFEYPLQLGDGTPSGYLIASSTHDLPPILEFSFAGDPLSSHLNRYLRLARGVDEGGRSSLRWYYWNPLEMVAGLGSQEGPRSFVSIPTLERVTLPEPHDIRRDPSTLWADGHAKERWSLIDMPKHLADRSPGIVLASMEPTAYNQNRRDGAIAGCVPVAAAMIASCWKKVSREGSDVKVWPGSLCWYLEWPPAYSGTDPSRCIHVENTIWEFHASMGTTDDGFTSVDNFERPLESYLSDRWGLAFDFASMYEPPFTDIQKIIDGTIMPVGDPGYPGKQPFVFMAAGQWSKYLDENYQGLSSLVRGKKGHAVVCWGYDPSPMVGGPMLLVTLGWGNDSSNPGSKWVYYDAFQERYCFDVLFTWP